MADRWFGDFEDAWAAGDVLGVLTGGLTRGVGRQAEEAGKKVNKFAGEVGEALTPIVKGITGETAAEAAIEAAEIQAGAAEKGIEEQKRQFEETADLLSDYVNVGDLALEQQAVMAGLGDPGEYEKIIQGIKSGPQYQEMVKSGEESILSAASATGGLRGGNVQGALAQYSPQVLNDLITQRYSQLSGLSGRGQQAAAQTGQFGQGMANQVSGLYGDIGAYNAGSVLSQAQAANALPNLIMKGIGTGLGAYLGGPQGAYMGSQIAGKF